MNSSSHHNHPSHTHNFINKHTAFGILLIIIFCFWAGYFVGQRSLYGSPEYTGAPHEVNETY